MSRSSSTERARSDSEEDAALVLGDLVRIGEASRLRRRGALRLDLSTAATTPDDELAALAAAADTQPFTYRVYCGAQRWTGCQALVHDRAAPSTRDATWVARGRAQPAVVRLGAAYFARGGRKVRRPCGCASDGVGCRVWCVPSRLCPLVLTGYVQRKRTRVCVAPVRAPRCGRGPAVRVLRGRDGLGACVRVPAARRAPAAAQLARRPAADVARSSP